MAERGDGRATFVKVFGRDSRDADLLYRGYRALLLRGPNDSWPSPSLKSDVEHEAFLLLLARQSGVTCPGGRGDRVARRRLDRARARVRRRRRLDELTPERDRRRSPRRHLARGRRLHAGAWRTGRCAPATCSSAPRGRSSSTSVSAKSRRRRGCRLSIVPSCSRPLPCSSVPSERSRRRHACSERAHSSTRCPTCNRWPCRPRPASRCRSRCCTTSETRLRREWRGAVALERLVRVRPRTVITIAALVGAFYVLLPQLANVGDSFRALARRELGLVDRLRDHVVAHLRRERDRHGRRGDREPARSAPTSKRSSASSFVNRVSPANVGGMALNVRFLQKAGVPTAEAVTGVGLNSLVGAIVHVVLLVLFFAWAGQGGGQRVLDPGRQQGARDHRRRARGRRGRRGDSARPSPRAHPRARIRQAGMARHRRRSRVRP